VVAQRSFKKILPEIPIAISRSIWRRHQTIASPPEFYSPKAVENQPVFTARIKLNLPYKSI
jgi:hypothetical protein